MIGQLVDYVNLSQFYHVIKKLIFNAAHVTSITRVPAYRAQQVSGVRACEIFTARRNFIPLQLITDA